MSENNSTTPNPPAAPETAQQQGQLQQPLASNPAPNVNSAGENLQCQWQGCGERCPSAEALYEHVCERHVGRKSTNNLNLTCAWGQCRTTTVKRDHITSHIRVHVPLKPHKCEFCGKAFKRPQDLKKHVKTHADDSVIMRSPNLEPGGGQRQVQNGMGQVPQNYYAPAMPGPHDYAGQQHPNQYYQPHPQVPTGGHPGYGPVTYYSTGPPSAAYDFESRKRGFDALDHFFGQVRRREVDPINFQNVSRRLFELQGLQLPQIIPAALPTPAYQPVAVGGHYGQEDPIQAYSLPPMGNAKTREDLTSIDQILEQMQATIYEQDAHLGVAPGAGYGNYARASNSPPGSSHHGSVAAHANAASLLQHGHQDSVASATDASTPGLTPPSSAQSYTSGQSPLPGHAAPTSSAMYPTLPANASDMAYAAASAATLSGLYEEDRRRWDGGRLQRAAPGRNKDDMDLASDGSVTPPASAINKESKGKKRDSPGSSVIDPALSTDGSRTPRDSKDSPDQTEMWVQNMRLIEWMREFIKKKLESGDFDGGAASEDAKVDKKKETDENADTDMGGTDDKKEDSSTTDEEQLYPVLRHVEEST